MRLFFHPLRFRRILFPFLVLCCVIAYFWLPSGSNTNVTSSSLRVETKANAPQPPKAELIMEQSQIKPPDHSRATQITQEEITGGAPQNETLAAIRKQIREMTKHAWDGYVKHAWGYNELKPVSKAGHQPSVLGTAPLGATIVDALDTLYIMGLWNEFNQARKYIAEELKFNQLTQVSVFEFTIRYLGGLLTAYTFTLDELFLNTAVALAKRLLPAFQTQTGIPKSWINLHTGQCGMFSWSRKQCAVLSEAGTLHMEFKYLSELTGDPIYAAKVDAIRAALKSVPRPNGLFYNFVDYRDYRWCDHTAGLGGWADSFYEYLLKEWIRTDHADQDARAVYNESIEALYRNGLFKRSAGGHLYVGSYKDGTVSNVMDHLTCFAGGMLALGASNQQDPWFERAVQLGDTCKYSYDSAPTNLGPDSFEFNENAEAVAVRMAHKSYLQRPETVETYFYLWRLTKNEDYRRAALKVVQALEKYARTESGFAGLSDVYSLTPKLDDVQQSYFLAETLKYLYLIFSEDSLLPLDRWVFNSEGHPFPVHNRVSLGSGVWPKPYATTN